MGCHKSIGETKQRNIRKRESSLKLWVSSMYTTMVGVGSLFKNERNNRVIVGGRYSRLAPQPDKEKILGTITSLRCKPIVHDRIVFLNLQI